MKTAPRFLLLLSLSAPLNAGEVTITLPPETGTYKAVRGVALAQTHCVVCHSADYVTTQPPMPRRFWETTVKKMKEKYGAPIPDAQVSGLVDYLTAAYAAPEK